MSDQLRLDELWRTRNAAAATLALAEEQFARLLRAASIKELVGLLELYSPALATGPEWTRTFDPLVERLWMWVPEETMAGLATRIAAKGPPWIAVAHALSRDNGARIRASVRQPAWARLPAFGLV